MKTLLVGFDSAWTPANAGALVGILCLEDGTYQELGPPEIATFGEAQRLVEDWQAVHNPSSTLVLLDQPTVVVNPTGCRPVERIAGAAISRRYGGMQPASRAKATMFGPEAPVWRFIDRFGGPAVPQDRYATSRVLETYPALALIALGWCLPDRPETGRGRPAGRLPKYNPANRKKFNQDDWRHVCAKVRDQLLRRSLVELARWADGARTADRPRKADQDKLDACLCLLVALHLAEGKECLVVGNYQSGYILVPDSEELRGELTNRCRDISYTPGDWLAIASLG